MNSGSNSSIVGGMEMYQLLETYSQRIQIMEKQIQQLKEQRDAVISECRKAKEQREVAMRKRDVLQRTFTCREVEASSADREVASIRSRNAQLRDEIALLLAARETAREASFAEKEAFIERHALCVKEVRRLLDLERMPK